MLLTIVGVETIVVGIVSLTFVGVGTGVIDIVVVVDDVDVVVVIFVVVIFVIAVADVVVAVVVSLVVDDLQTIPPVRLSLSLSVMYNTNASVGLRSEQAGKCGLLRRASAYRAP